MTRPSRWVTAGRPSSTRAGAAARLVAVALLAAALTSCGDGGESDLPAFQDGGANAGSSDDGQSSGSEGPGPSATVGSKSDAVVVTLESGSSKGSERVLIGLQGFATDLNKAMAKPSDPPDSKHATASGQTIIDRRAEQLKDAKRSTKGQITLTARIRVSGTRATVNGCLDQSKVQSLDAKGKQLKLDEPPRLKYQAQLAGSGESWRVQSFSVPGDPC